MNFLDSWIPPVDSRDVAGSERWFEGHSMVFQRLSKITDVFQGLQKRSGGFQRSIRVHWFQRHSMVSDVFQGVSKVFVWVSGALWGLPRGLTDLCDISADTRQKM